MSQTNITKQCTKCKKLLNLDNFRKDKSKRDGIYPSCNDCHRITFGITKGGFKKPARWHLGNDGYIHRGDFRQHRMVMEEYLDRKLLKNEHVHHINHDKTDNRIENLQVLSASEHQRIHPGRNKRGKILICTNCGKNKYYPISSLKNVNQVHYRCWNCYKSVHYSRNYTDHIK